MIKFKRENDNGRIHYPIIKDGERIGVIAKLDTNFRYSSKENYKISLRNRNLNIQGGTFNLLREAKQVIKKADKKGSLKRALNTEISLSFYECEHDGDLRRYAYDVRDCGGIIVGENLNIEAEIGRLYVEVKDESEFWKEFRESDSYGFLN